MRGLRAALYCELSAGCLDMLTIKIQTARRKLTFNRQITVRATTTKTLQSRIVPISKRLYDVLDAARVWQPTPVYVAQNE